MTLSRRARVTLGAVGAVLLGGMLGLALWLWWSWRHQPGRRPVARFRRVRVAVVAAGLLIVAVGAVWRFAVVFEHTPVCTPSGGAQAPVRTARFDASLVAQQVATWPETGIGLLYSRVRDAHICVSRTADYYVAVHANNPVGARALNLGDIVLSPGFDKTREQLRGIILHEARHRTQWAVLTVIAGPLAFPVAYAIDDFFFPGARNHFERLAGLDAGGYSMWTTRPCWVRLSSPRSGSWPRSLSWRCSPHGIGAHRRYLPAPPIYRVRARRESDQRRLPLPAGARARLQVGV